MGYSCSEEVILIFFIALQQWYVFPQMLKNRLLWLLFWIYVSYWVLRLQVLSPSGYILSYLHMWNFSPIYSSYAGCLGIFCCCCFGIFWLGFSKGNFWNWVIENKIVQFVNLVVSSGHQIFIECAVCPAPGEALHNFSL